jgi:hypothetical protein
VVRRREVGETWGMRALLCAVALLCVRPTSADACLYPPLPTHELDPMHADDDVAPEAPRVTYNVTYVDGDDQSDCGGDYGFLAFAIAGRDDRTPLDRLGIVMAPAPGARLPQYFGLFPPLPGEAPYGIESASSYVSYRFDYNAKVLDFELDVQVVDLNGNFSAPTRVHVVHDASGWCSAAGGRPHAWLASLGALAFVLLRRRSRVRLRQCQKLRST